MLSTKPQVTVGVPVRNGGATLRRALESIISQSYDDLAIIISDNCSTDETAAVAAEFAARDDRIRYIRQHQPLTVMQNFRFVVDQAKTEYFMWAADDDFRSANYVEVLLEALIANPRAVLSYGDIVHFSDGDVDLDAIPPIVLDASWENRSYYGMINNLISNKCYVMYGLFRTRYLQEYSWIETDCGPDIPMLLFLKMRGDFVYAPDTTFYEWIVKGGIVPAADRARNEALRDLRQFWIIRVAWACALAAAEASVLERHRSRRAATFLASYSTLKTQSTKLWIYQHAPRPLQRAWHLFRPPHLDQAASASPV